MPNVQDVIHELEATSGGSLVKQIRKFHIAQGSSVLFVGLGGLGSKTINVLKGIFNREYEYSNSVGFLAVDTDTGDQGDIRFSSPNGNMLDDELFQIFDDSSINLLINTPRPPEIEAWIGGLEPVVLDSTGAQGIRQIGRVMLCGTSKYDQLKTKIGLIAERLNRVAPLHVVIVAGISGGTGSGTFIDVSYMVRDILSGMTQRNNQVFQWGVFYTPEVQHHIPTIEGNPDVWKALKRNGYAALKELDYFMNNGTMLQAAEPIYKLSMPGGTRVTSAQPIFDDGRVFLVSGNGALQACDSIVDATARNLLTMFQENNAAGTQAFTSDASNIPGHLDLWRTTHVGIAVNGNNAPLGIEGAEFPVSMNYQFLSLGHGSVYFPRDEVLAYCANEVMNKVNDVWTNAGRLNQRMVDGLLAKVELDSIAHVLAKSKQIANITASELRINQVRNNAAWPEVTMYAFGYGRVRGTSSTMTFAAKRADDVFQQVNDKTQCAKLAIRLAEGLTSYLGTTSFLTNWGPFAAIASLTGYGEVRGACDILDDLVASLPSEVRNAQDREDAAESYMREQASILEGDHTPTDPEIDVFIDACEAYSVARFDRLFLSGAMKTVLQLTRRRLQDYNNDTFSIYVPVMEALTEALNHDATILATVNHRVDGNRETFGMDAYGLGESETKRDMFMRLFSSHVDSAQVRSVATRFAQSMLGEGSRERWQGFAKDPQSLVDEIRSVFSDFFGPFVNGVLEKLAVLAYASPESIGDVTVARLNAIWDAPAGTIDAATRDNAISSAGNAIARMLEEGSAPLVELEGGDPMLQKSFKRYYLTLLQSMSRLNPAIIAGFADPRALGIGYIGDDSRPVVRCVRYVGPIALPLVRYSAEWMKGYFESELGVGTAAGRHLDEKDQNWAARLPEPFGMDAQTYYARSGRRDLVIHGHDGLDGADGKLYQIIREALNDGVEHGYVYFFSKNPAEEPDHTVDSFVVVHDVETPDGMGALRKTFEKVLRRNPDASLSECLREAKETDFSAEYTETRLKTNNDPLKIRQLETPDNPREFSNLCRIVRGNLASIEALFSAREQFEGSSQREANGVLAAFQQEKENDAKRRKDTVSRDRYQRLLPLFANMWLCDLVEYRQGRRSNMGSWYYRNRQDGEFRELCKIHAMRPGLEAELILYFAFTKGVWTLPEEIVKVLEKSCDQLIMNGDYASEAEAEEMRGQVQTVLDHDSLTEFDTKLRDAALKEMVDISYSKDDYSVPSKVADGADVYNNLTTFYGDLLKRLEV